jgi:hypothetical protein
VDNIVILPKNNNTNYGIGINYELVLNCISDYCLEEDEYTFMSTVVVSINRLIEKQKPKIILNILMKMKNILSLKSLKIM